MKINEAPLGPLGPYHLFDQTHLRKNTTGGYILIGVVESDLEPLIGEGNGIPELYANFTALKEFIETQYGAELYAQSSQLQMVFELLCPPEMPVEKAISTLTLDSLVDFLYTDATTPSPEEGYSVLAKSFQDWAKIWA